MVAWHGSMAWQHGMAVQPGMAARGGPASSFAIVVMASQSSSHCNHPTLLNKLCFQVYFSSQIDKKPALSASNCSTVVAVRPFQFSAHLHWFFFFEIDNIFSFCESKLFGEQYHVQTARDLSDAPNTCPKGLSAGGITVRDFD